LKRAILFVFIGFLAARTSAASPSSNDLPFQLFRGYLALVQCSIKDQPDLMAIIDTGTTETILDLKFVQRLALASRPDSATSLTSDTPALAVSIPDLRLGPVRVQKLDGIAMDLSAIGRELGVHPDVVIGMDVLHRTNFTIDYSSRVIRFNNPEALAHCAAIAPSGRFVLVDSHVLGKLVTLKLDTGFNGLLVYGNRVGSLTQPASSEGRIAGVAQASSVRNVDSPEVRVGDWHASHLAVAVIASAPRDLSLYDGLLGPRLLGAKRIAFDFDHRVLYWE
jgi:predicted aspartyl protease